MIGISPFLEPAAKEDTFRQTVRFLIETMPLNSSLWLYDAYHLRTIATIEVPGLRAFSSGKTRANQFQDRIRDLKNFLAHDHSKPTAGSLDFTQAVRLPQFLDFLAANAMGPDHNVVAMVLGSPLYLDAKEPTFAMTDGYFPSDGHLAAARDKSVFGLKDRGEALKGLTVHLGYFGTPWSSAIHEERVVRFWTLFVELQGGRLATCTGDLPTVFQAVRAPGTSGPDPEVPVKPRYALDPEQTKVEMLRITRDMGISDWITKDLSGGERPAPPSTQVGPMKIGIRWRGAWDLDLYARPASHGVTLYFERTRSDEGYYFKDHRKSPDREYEFIEFEKPVDLREVEASVNFYEGEAPDGAAGEVRVEFGGRIYSGRFVVSGRQGNRGRGGESQERFWVRLDIPRIVGWR
ncbi:MAG: hypothetical protein JNK85_07285 [Verrucomicrobiales bacterium]|nr:hypothetical protein [Verrucomicrobiales bacterium]